MARLWLGQVLRLTYFFPGQRDQSSFAGLWQSAMDQSPEVDEAKPRENRRTQGGFLSDTLGLEVQTQPGRIDWFVATRESGVDQMPKDNFGPIEPTLAIFNDVMLRWLKNPGLDCTRLAVGMVLLSPVPDRNSGYRAVSELEPAINLEPPDKISDFNLQLNRPIQSTNADLLLNRLARWSVARLHSFAIQLGQDAKPVPVTAKENYYVRLELDLSTPPTAIQTPLPKDTIEAIFKEMQVLGLHMAMDGVNA